MLTTPGLPSRLWLKRYLSKGAEISRTAIQIDGELAGGRYMGESNLNSSAEISEREVEELHSRICLYRASTIAAHEIHRSSNKGARNAHAAAAFRHEQAYYRPYGSVINGFEYPGPGKTGIVGAGCNGAPPYRFAVMIRDDPGNFSRGHDLLHLTAVLLTLGSLVLLRRLPPPHAPAATTRTSLAEECSEVVPPVAC